MMPEIGKGERLRSLIRGGQSKKKRKSLILAGVVLLICLPLIYFLLLPLRSAFPPASTRGPANAVLKESQTPGVEQEVIQGEVKAGSTLSKSLAEKNIPPTWVDLIVSKLKPHINFRKTKGGTYHLVKDGAGELAKFVYEEGPAEVYEVVRDGQGYQGQKKEIPLETSIVKVVGVIQSSIFEAMEAAGEKDALTLSFAEILAWEVDFYKDVRKGDRFKIVVEKLHRGDQFVRYGTIHAVEYQSGCWKVRGVEYEGHYYHEDGTSLRKAFLKTPLRFSRISSRFSRARKHPILGGVFPHYGVDYAAPPGTPVWAVADGLVIGCGWSGGFGKQVVLRHKNGYTTYYGHLSRYGAGIRLGARVKQKQIIGYVGSTGLSTGPHLDYRLSKDGRFRNPLKESFPSGLPIAREIKEAFEKRRDEVMAWFEGDTAFQQRHPSTPSAVKNGPSALHRRSVP
ncbi:MAG: peptidoglycan DD-metalloendopeptidase family protein [Thermodesulfobacteriota bacterium]